MINDFKDDEEWFVHVCDVAETDCHNGLLYEGNLYDKRMAMIDHAYIGSQNSAAYHELRFVILEQRDENVHELRKQLNARLKSAINWMKIK